MLTVLRDWEGESSVKSPDPKETDDIRRRLYVLIYRAVFVGKSSRAKHLNGLIDLFDRNFLRVTWASFNWDCIFESSFFYHSGPPGGRYNPNLAIDLDGWRTGSSKHEYLKLHGSVNWWLIGDRPTALSWGSNGELDRKWDELAQNKTTDRPIILEPSAYKYEGDLYSKILEPQWERFLARLCEADCVLIIGYSLPDNDLEARCKMLTAFQVNEQCLWAVVDSGEESRRKYQRLIGSKKLQMFDTSLAGFGVNLLDNLKKAFPGEDITAPPPAGIFISTTPSSNPPPAPVKTS